MRATWLGVVSVGWLLLGAVSCSKAPTASTPPPPPAVVAVPVQQDVTDFSYFTGVARASESAELRARVQGFLKTIHFIEGDKVEAGDLLFTVEQEPYQAKLDQTTARIKQAEAAVALAQATYDRRAPLVESRAVTPQELEELKAQLLAAKAQLLVEDAAAEAARIDLSYTEIRAPFPGQIGRSLVDEGNLVGAGENTLLTTIERMSPIEVHFDVPERAVLHILQLKRESQGAEQGEEKSMPIFAKLENEEKYAHEGKIDFVDNRADADTGTALMRARFENNPTYLYPGLFVRLRIPNEELKDALLVSERAIGTDLGGKFLLAVGKDNVVERRGVELGPQVGDLRVILSGIEDGQRYIVEGLQRARPGLPVTVKESE